MNPIIQSHISTIITQIAEVTADAHAELSRLFAGDLDSDIDDLEKIAGALHGMGLMAEVSIAYGCTPALTVHGEPALQAASLLIEKSGWKPIIKNPGKNESLYIAHSTADRPNFVSVHLIQAETERVAA